MVEVAWLNAQQRILRYRFSGQWDWDEYYTALAQGRQMLKAVAYLTCTINDFSLTDYLPPDFLEHAGHVRLTRPANTGLAVYISTGHHFGEIYDILCRVYPETPTLYPLVATEAEALALIAAWFAAHNTPRADDFCL